MIHVYVVSAFSKDGQGGNRAGVVLNRPELTPAQKMAAAAALGFSETAFVTASDRADVKLEYFTPTEEVPLCGHATIAAFTLLHLLGALPKRELLMETKAGLLRIAVSEGGAVRAVPDHRGPDLRQRRRDRRRICGRHGIFGV